MLIFVDISQTDTVIYYVECVLQVCQMVLKTVLKNIEHFKKYEYRNKKQKLIHVDRVSLTMS